MLTLTRCLLSRFVVCAIVTTLGVRCESGRVEKPPVSVSFVVTDCWGNSLPEATKIEITSVAAQSFYLRLAYPAEKSVSLLPGRYHVLIESRDFFSASSINDFSGHDVEVRSCLTLAPVEGVTIPEAHLNGVIHSAGSQPAGFWTRLVGLYSSVSVTAPVNSKGEFSFVELQPGHYLLLVFDRNGLAAQREVDVHALGTSVIVPIGDAPSQRKTILGN